MRDLSINLLASVIFYLLGFATKWGWTRYKSRGQRRFWAPFLKGRGALSVILTDKAGNAARSPRKISLTDVHAYSDVRSVLSSLGREVEIKAGSQADIAQLSNDCFVSLGGPLANGISEQVLNRLGQRLPVTFDPTHKCFEFAGGKFCPSYDEGQRVKSDYGLIIRLQKLDPADINSKPALVVFGLHGHGTQQAVRAIITNDELGSQFKSLLSGDLYALLKFTFTDHKCTGSTVVKVDKIG